MNRSVSSYEFETFQDSEKAKEILRLKHKAAALLSIDKKNWERAGLTSEMRVLDLGCGSGMTSCEIAKTIPSGEVVGVDWSQTILEQAQSLKESESLDNVVFQQGNAYDLNFPVGTFDFVYSRFLFQHLAEPIKALTEIYRVLKPGGRLCVLDVDEDWFTLYPEPKSFARLRQSLVTVQQSQGGDPSVGRKLSGYFRTAGFAHVQTSIETLSSDELGLNSLFNLLSFGAAYYSSREGLAEIATEAREGVYALLSHPAAWAGLGIFVAIGCKP